MTQVQIKVAHENSVDILAVIKRSPVYDNANAVAILNNWWLASDKVWAGMVDGEIACLWGLAPPTFLSENAYLWLLTTDLVEEHKFLFIRYSQRYVEEMLKVYPRIVGHVETTNTQAIRWIRWLGAKIGEPENGFRPFTIRRR
jgi:hypothetical protein